MNTLNSTTKLNQYRQSSIFTPQLEICKPQKVKHLCDRLVFEYERHLRDYEIKALSKISMRYQGRATDRELIMIADICDRVGIAGGIE